MEVVIGKTRLELTEGDITGQSVDVIVNAANAQLSGGGGVDGAIHRAGGPEIMIECRRIGGCPTGQAVTTTAGRLGARKVIHAVGPVYRDGAHGEPELLASAYREAFTEARKLGFETVSTPALSTGAYGYPIDEAARVALSTAMDFLLRNPGKVRLIRFVLHGREAYHAFRRVLEELAPTQQVSTP